jgi:hypothetical protein
MVGCGQMRCWARLSLSLLMLCLTAVGVKVDAAADEGQQPGEQRLDRDQRFVTPANTVARPCCDNPLVSRL